MVVYTVMIYTAKYADGKHYTAVHPSILRCKCDSSTPIANAQLSVL